MTPDQLRDIALEVAKECGGGVIPTLKEDDDYYDFALRFLAAITEKADAVAYRSRMYPDKIYFASQCDDGFKRSNIPLFRHPAIEPAPQPTGWQPIETAPKDGTHILVRSLIGSEPPTVCHWFNGDWHLSVNRNGDDSEFQAAFWREI